MTNGNNEIVKHLRCICTDCGRVFIKTFIEGKLSLCTDTIIFGDSSKSEYRCDDPYSKCGFCREFTVAPQRLLKGGKA